MVLGIQIIDLQQVVIDILDAYFRPHSVQLHGFERQHCERAGRVLGERLVNPQRQRRAHSPAAAYAMSFDQLLCDVQGHCGRCWFEVNRLRLLK